MNRNAAAGMASGRRSRPIIVSLDDEESTVAKAVGELAAPDDYAPDNDDDAELGKQVRETVAKLPDRQRKVIAARYFYGLSVKACSKKLRLPKRTIEREQAAGLAKLLRMLAPTMH